MMMAVNFWAVGADMAVILGPKKGKFWPVTPIANGQGDFDVSQLWVVDLSSTPQLKGAAAAMVTDDAFITVQGNQTYSGSFQTLGPAWPTDKQAAYSGTVYLREDILAPLLRDAKLTLPLHAGPRRYDYLTQLDQLADGTIVYFHGFTVRINAITRDGSLVVKIWKRGFSHLEETDSANKSVDNVVVAAGQFRLIANPLAGVDPANYKTANGDVHLGDGGALAQGNKGGLLLHADVIRGLSQADQALLIGPKLPRGTGG